jgi:ACS family tartrate transporter-like MFS transporter
MGLLSGWLLGLDGVAGLRGWQWLFLVEGLPAVVIGLAVLFWRPDGPRPGKVGCRRTNAIGSRANWREKSAQLQQTRVTITFWLTLGDRHVLQRALVGRLTIGSYMSFQLFLPQRLAAGTWAGCNICRLSRQRCRHLPRRRAGRAQDGAPTGKASRFTHLLIGCSLVAMSCLILAAAPSPGRLLAAYDAISFFWPSVTLSTLVLCTEIVPKRTVGVASGAVNTLSQLGAFAGPWLVGISRDATGSYHLAQMLLPVGFALSVGITLNLRRELRAKQPHLAVRPVPAA